MSAEPATGVLRYSVSLVTQGTHRFYTLTMPSDVLAETTFVTNRFEDPQEGFQRLLDRDRAADIAKYIDEGLGTIPNSIVLSAQPDAHLRVIGRGKTLEFQRTAKAFLILDGQHRVYGFSIAKTSLRVPVVIFNGLTRKDESRLFIDINTRQRPVPNELLLDIKKLAEYESETEQMMGEIFDLFQNTPGSPLAALLSPASRTSGRISRVTFNAAVKPLLPAFQGSSSETIFGALSAYLAAFVAASDRHGGASAITNPTVFRAVLLLFQDVAQRVKDRYDRSYNSDHFHTVLRPLFSRLPSTALSRPGNSYKELYDSMARALRTSFTL